MKNSLPIENWVCSLEQAKEFADLLGNDAPESLWVWVTHRRGQYGELPFDKNKNQYFPVLREEVFDGDYGAEFDHSAPIYPAYTGDELGFLLPKCLNLPEAQLPHIRSQVLVGTLLLINNNWLFYYEGTHIKAKGINETQAKATLAIKGIKQGWIKKERFNYGDN